MNLDANPYTDLFKAAGAKYGVDYRLLEAMAVQESGFNPKAVSSAGAMGLMQFMPGTAKSYGIDPWDPAQAIDGAARYIQNSLRYFNGDVSKAVASYNAGLGGNFNNSQTANYVKSIMAMYSGAGGGGPETFVRAPSGDQIKVAIAAAQANANNGDNIRVAVAAAQANGGKVAGAPTKIPGGGMLITINGGNFPQLIFPAVWDPANPKNNTWIMYTLNGPGGLAGYDLSNVPRLDMSADQFNAQFRSGFIDHEVNAGDAGQLDSIAKTYGDYGNFWKWILDSHLGANAQARNDPGVQAVMAHLAGRPDMGDAELQNLLKMTDFFKTHTQQQLDWNDLSPAEQTKQTADVQAQLSDQFFQLVGHPIDPNNPQESQALQFFGVLVASGQKGMNEIVQTWIKAEAVKNPESPWSRTIRTEKENELQRGDDISNQTQKVQDLANQWGVNLSGSTLKDWGTNIINKSASEADLTNYLKQQAQIMYPWLKQVAPDMPTVQAAQPWLQTFERVMEKPGDILNPQIQQALSQGTPVWQFEQQLKQDPAWTQTKNAQQTMESMLGQVGKSFGFG